VADVDALIAGAGQPIKHPDGWTPGITYGPNGGEVVAKVVGDGVVDPAFWDLVIADWGFDPKVTEIVPDSVQIRAWDMPVAGGGTMRAKYYKARIRPKRAAMTDAETVALAKLVNRRKTRRQIALRTRVDVGVAFVVNLSDFQIGKGEGGGTPATIIRVKAAVDEAKQRYRDLRKLGRNIVAVYLIGMGDLAEQCFGNYPNQLFTVDCTRRRQLEVVRELILYAIDAFVDLTPRIVVGAVPGNHGENRSNGKAVTTVDDNDDLAVFDQVREQCVQNPGRYGHVEWEICNDLVLTLDVCGAHIAWTHMHQGAGSGEKKIAEWWRGQVMGNQPVSEAQILNTAHYHHFLMSESTGRTILQVPAMDGGSKWWTDRTGNCSPAGMVTYLAGAGCGSRGWSDLAIVGGDL
jgi:hypothetical protein